MDMDEAYEAEVMERIRTMQSDPEVGEKVRKLITAHNQFLALKRYVMHYASRDRGVEEGYCYLYHYVGRE